MLWPKIIFWGRKSYFYSTFHTIYAEYFHVSPQYSAFSYFQKGLNLLYFGPNEELFSMLTHLVSHQSPPFVMLWIHSPLND